MGVCSQCQHFRRVKPGSQLLATIFSTTDADISHALNKIVEDEGKQRDEESQYKRSQATAGKSAWAYRPVMSDYCGLNEKNGEYYIAEVLNAGQQCTKFEQGKPVRHACSDCVHSRAPEGAEKDRSTEEAYNKMIVQATNAKASAGQPEALLKTHREGAAARKAFEMAGIYSTKGVLAAMPNYADYCSFFSGPDEFVICALYNSHSTCDKWEGTGATDSRAPATAPEAAAPTATPETPAPGPIAASVPVPAAVNRPTGGDILVSGPVPLTRTLVAKTAEALGWLLEVNIPPEVAALIQSQLAEDWTKGDSKSIGETQQLVTSYDLLSGFNLESRDAVREDLQPEFVVGLREQNVPVAAALIGLYDRANAPIAMGNPPLTREIANCFLELMGLIQALQQGVEWQPLPEPMKLAFSQVLATQYSSLDPTQQAWFGSLPKGWTALRASWKNVPPAEREQLRQQILASLGALAEAAPSIQAMGTQPTSTQPTSTQPTSTQPTSTQPIGPAQSEVSIVAAATQSTDDLFAKIVSDGKAEENRLMKENPELALQVRLQNEARSAQLMTSMMSMRHETCMSIIRNMR